MNKLKVDGSNNFVITHKNFFKDELYFNRNDILLSLDFAYEMCFGSGHHRGCRSGGQYDRKNGEKFCNTFQGKLAEIALYNYLLSNKVNCAPLDFSIHGKNIWDDSDLDVNGKKINIKSAASFSNLLLLETKDWNSIGQYIPNLQNTSTAEYDYFVLIRIKPDVKKLFRNNRIFYSNEIAKSLLEQIVLTEKWYYDFAGFITKETLIYVIANEFILPKNGLLNGRISMDAENYYIQSGDMENIDNLINKLI